MQIIRTDELNYAHYVFLGHRVASAYSHLGRRLVISCLDVSTWKLEPSGRFSIKSLYNRLAAGQGPNKLRELWKVRLLPRIFFSSCGNLLGIDYHLEIKCSNEMVLEMVNVLCAGWRRT